MGNVVLNPLNGSYLIKGAVVARHMLLVFGSEFGMSQETEDAHTIVDGYQNHTTLSPGITVHCHLIAVAVVISATMYPHSYWQFLLCMCGCVGRSPDIQEETVLAELRVASSIKLFPVEIACSLATVLHGSSAPCVSHLHALPSLDRLWGSPTKVTHRCRSIRYTFIY